jgi:hypothetical protein
LVVVTFFNYIGIKPPIFSELPDWVGYSSIVIAWICVAVLLGNGYVSKKKTSS